jgi:hypothetical protein
MDNDSTELIVVQMIHCVAAAATRSQKNKSNRTALIVLQKLIMSSVEIKGIDTSLGNQRDQELPCGTRRRRPPTCSRMSFPVFAALLGPTLGATLGPALGEVLGTTLGVALGSVLGPALGMAMVRRLLLPSRTTTTMSRRVRIPGYAGMHVFQYQNTSLCNVQHKPTD